MPLLKKIVKIASTLNMHITQTFKYLPLLFLLLFTSAQANEIERTVLELHPLPIEYGTNTFLLNGLDIAIIRAELPSETAGNGDVYTVMYQHPDHTWQLVQYTDHSFSTATWPYTSEDAISALRFLTSKENNAPELSSLYLLKARRSFNKSTSKPGIVTFELYQVTENKDFGFMQFKKLDDLATEKEYHNVNTALDGLLNP